MKYEGVVVPYFDSMDIAGKEVRQNGPDEAACVLPFRLLSCAWRVSAVADTGYVRGGEQQSRFPFCYEGVASGVVRLIIVAGRSIYIAVHIGRPCCAVQCTRPVPCLGDNKRP